MVALTADRNTPLRSGDLRVGQVGAATKILKGARIMRNAAGYLIKGATAVGSFGVGLMFGRFDTSDGPDPSGAVAHGSASS